MFDAKRLLDYRNECPRTTVDTIAGPVPVQGLTALELAQWRQLVQDTKNKDLIPAKMMQLGIRDDDGKRCFTESQIFQLLELPAAISEPVCDAICALSGIGNDGELLKNLMTQSGEASFESKPTTD